MTTTMIRLPLELTGITAASWIVAMAIDPSLFAAAVVTVVVALTAATVAIIKAVAESKKDLLAAAAEAAVRVGEVHEEAKGIAHSVNGAASKQVDRIDELERRIERLVKQLSESKETAVALAATTAATIPGVDAARAEGRAQGIEQERSRGGKK